MNVYFISGVGVDGRIFRNIRLPEGYTAVYLDWIKPEDDETLESYAERMAVNIDAGHPFILIGLSFGGMIATEIAKRYPPAGIFLISSIPSAKQLPGYFRLAGKLRLHQWVPVQILKSASLLKRLFTAETPEEKKFLRQAIAESDPSFIRWSLNAIINWKSDKTPASYIHIHGSRDEVLPVRYTHASHVIKGGGHLMVLTRAGEINSIIQETLASIESNQFR